MSASTIRAKFRINSVETKGSQLHVNATPVTSTNDPNSENSRFWTATPNGSLNLAIDNKEAWSFFKTGDEIYLDLSSAAIPASR